MTHVPMKLIVRSAPHVARRSRSWGTGAVGNAEWAGVPLAHVLGEARIAPSALSVLREGLDTTAVERGVAAIGDYPLGVSPPSIASRNLCIPDDGLSRGNSVPFRLWRSSSARARRAASARRGM